MRQDAQVWYTGMTWGVGWGGRWEGCSEWGTHVCLWLIDPMFGKKPLQYFEVINLQLKLIN